MKRSFLILMISILLFSCSTVAVDDVSPEPSVPVTEVTEAPQPAEAVIETVVIGREEKPAPVIERPDREAREEVPPPVEEKAPVAEPAPAPEVEEPAPAPQLKGKDLVNEIENKLNGTVPETPAEEPAPVGTAPAEEEKPAEAGPVVTEEPAAIVVETAEEEKPVIEEAPAVTEAAAEEVAEEAPAPVTEEPAAEAEEAENEPVVTEEPAEDPAAEEPAVTVEEAPVVAEEPAETVEEAPEKPVPAPVPEIKETAELPAGPLDSPMSEPVFSLIVKLVIIIVLFTLASVVRSRYNMPLPWPVALVLSVLLTAVPMLTACILEGWSLWQLPYLAIILTFFVFRQKNRK